MIKHFISITLFTLLISCIQDRKDNVYIEKKLYPNEELRAVLDSFVFENKKLDSICEIYIDNILPEFTSIIIYSGHGSCTGGENIYYNQRPLGYTEISGIRFRIFSGMEHYFNLLENMENAPKITSSDLSEPDLKIYYENFLYFNSNSIWWVLIKNGNKSTLYRNWDGVYPYNFYPFRHVPGLLFNPPVIKDVCDEDE